MRTTGSVSINWRAASWAGIAYTIAVFMFAFAIGVIQVTLVVPRLGPLLAVIIEAPIVLSVSWLASLWCTRRFNVSRDAGARTLMGAVAFTFLMLLEMGFSVFVFGEPIGRYFAKYTSIPGAIGLVMQGCFATLPWVQCHLTSGARTRCSAQHDRQHQHENGRGDRPWKPEKKQSGGKRRSEIDNTDERGDESVGDE